MVCLYCGNQLEVFNSRSQHRSNQVWRRRNCPACKAKFTTLEKIDLRNSIMVQDTGGNLKKFERDTLFLSIYKSTGHRTHAITDASALTDSVIQHILQRARGGTVLSRQIAESVIKVMRNFDKAAVVQYQAYHPDSVE